jgi:hypothetical protein
LSVKGQLFADLSWPPTTSVCWHRAQVGGRLVSRCIAVSKFNLSLDYT